MFTVRILEFFNIIFKNWLLKMHIIQTLIKYTNIFVYLINDTDIVIDFLYSECNEILMPNFNFRLGGI